MEFELQQISGLSEEEICEYVTIFEKERLDSNTLQMIDERGDVSVLVSVGIPVGRAVNILNHFRMKNNKLSHIPSAPTTLNIPHCTVHPSQEIFAMCMHV